VKGQADLCGQLVELNEIDDEGVFVIVAPGLDADMEVVTMEIFTTAVEGDEVSGVEMQFTRVNAHSEGLRRTLQRLAPIIVMSSGLFPGSASIPGHQDSVNLTSLADMQVWLQSTPGNHLPRQMLFDINNYQYNKL